jgi:cell division protein FtsA
MHESNPSHYFGLDIGTSAVRCVVGMLDPSDPSKVSIVGHGQAPNLGMRRGVIVHVDDVVESVMQAVTEAERISGIQINHATVNVNGPHVLGLNSKGVIAISTANREITIEDCIRVEEAATILQLPPNREIIQVFAKNYKLDGQGSIKDPVGMNGVRLEVDTHIITAATSSLKNLYSVLEKTSIRANHHTVSSLAAVEAVLNRQQKEAGTLLLDIGAGTTNLAVIEDGEIQHVAVIPIGGIHFTNDLAICLKTDLDIAEAVKVKYATLEDKKNNDHRVKIEVDKKEHSFSTSDIYMVVEARLEELLEYVDKELRKIHKTRKLPGGVVLVGGTSKLPGIDAFTRDKLELPARLGKLQNLHGLVDTVEDPVYTTSVGLMMLDMLLGGADDNDPNTRTKINMTSVRNLTSRFTGRFK